MTFELVSVAEGAARLGDHVTESWYLRKLRDGVFPGHKVGRRWMLSEEDIQAAFETLARPASVPKPDSWQMTPTTRRRAAKRGGGRAAS